MKFLTDSTWWQLGIVILVAGTVLYTLVSMIIKAGFTYKGFKVGKAMDMSGHTSCVKHRDFIIVMHLSIASAKKTFEIERITTISEQMSYAEQCLADLRKELRGIFLTVLKEVKGMDQPDGLLAMHESQDYNNVLRILNFELKDAVRRIFLENHLADMSDVEFEAHVVQRVKFLNDTATEILNEAYPNDMKPPIERLYTANMQITSKIDSLFEQMIRRGKIIAVANVAKVKEIEAETDAKIKELMNGTANVS